MPTAHATFLARLDRANRLRWRARFLELRAPEVIRTTGDYGRAFRIKERAERCHLRADLAPQGFDLCRHAA